MADYPVTQFQALFSGRNDAIGFGYGGVERREVTLLDYEDHLRGCDSGIGIFPMLDDNACWFGAIDLDEPNFKLAASMQLLIPGASWVEESRSGNAHVWVFFRTPAPAWAIRTILRGATEAVGRKDVEIFPKQDQLREGMVGNYINLPYHGAERPIISARSGYREVVAVEDFVAQAAETAHNPRAWERRAEKLGGVPPEQRVVESEWGESPTLHECAAYIIERREENPLRPGHRHQVLFHVAKQLLNWRDLAEHEAYAELEKLNAAGTRPLNRGELERLFHNAIVGRYTSTGCDDPIMQPYIHPDCPIANAA